MSNDSVNVQVSRQELLDAIRTDCVTFFSFYLGDELTLEIPEFHQEIWQELLEYLELVKDPLYLTGVLKKLFCVPRGHAKSTLTKLSVILFMRYSPLKFGVYASNTITTAIQAIKDIKTWFESANDEALYGPKITKWVEKSNEQQGLWILHINTPEYGVKRIILKALGSDSAVRGTLIDNTRPQFLVIDDCEDLDTASNETTQKRLDNWLMGSLLKALAKRALVIMLGNMISEKTIIARLSTNPEWSPTVFGAIVRNKKTGKLQPLWPGLYTLKELIKEYKEYRRMGSGHTWAHEMMNLTAEKVFGLDMANAVQIPQPNPDMIESGCIIIDPAFGLKSWNDESALTCHVQIKDSYYGHGIPHIVATRKGRWTEDQLLDELIEMSSYWGISTWCIEAVAAQRLFIPLFKNMLKIRQMNTETFLILPINGGTTSKGSRIIAFRNAVSHGTYGIADSEDELFIKLGEYNPERSDFDDLVDSAAMGTVAWEMYGTAIESKGTIKVAHSLWEHSHGARGLTQLQISPM